MWLCWVGGEAWTFWGCRRAEIMFWVGVRDATCLFGGVRSAWRRLLGWYCSRDYLSTPGDLQSCSGNVGTSSLGNYPSALGVKEPRSRHGEEGKIISCRLRHYFGDGVGVCHIYRAAAHMPFPLPFHCLSISGYQAVAQFL